MTATLEFAPPSTLREPPGIVSMALGDEFLEFAETCGITLDPWQQWCVRMATSQRKDGSWAAFENAVITPRQNGKNYYLRVLQLGHLFLMDDMLLFHSAHQMDTVNVHRKWFMDLLESHDEFRQLLKPIDRRTGRSKSFVNVNGDEQVVLTTGQVIVFKTRSAGKGLGFTGDKVFFDECQRLGAGSMGDTVPVLSTRPGAQLYYTGSAPYETSAVEHAVLARGESDNPDDKLFVAEWGNPPAVLDLDPDSEEFIDAIRNANPAVVAGRITEDYIRQEIRTFSGDPELVAKHRRERLGVRETPLGSIEDDPNRIHPTQWSMLTETDSTAGPEVRLAFNQSRDRTHCTFGLAGTRTDNYAHVETRDRRPGDDWVIERARQLTEGHDTPVIVVEGTPGFAFKALFDKAKIRVDVMTRAEFAASWVRFLNAVNGLTPTVRHHGQPTLSIAVEASRTKVVGELEVLSARKSTTDISPLETVVAAFGRLPIKDEDGDIYSFTVGA